MSLARHIPVVVAIPARNEAGHIGAALTALAAQPDSHRRIAAAIVHANNCTDDTAAIAQGMSLPFAVHVIIADLSPDRSHIGHVRRAVTDAAAAHLDAIGHPGGIIASTDADSRVAPGWLAALVGALAVDIDAVCGVIDLDGVVAPGLAATRRAEASHAEAAARASALLDPLAHDPWPNHIWSWGANNAVRADTLRAVGGSPLVSLAEDRALHAALLRHDARIRHEPGVRVLTSARTSGRAPGGFADLLADYADDPAAFADFALEPAAIGWLRAARRGTARRRWGNRPGFGAFWAVYEAESTELAQQRIALRDLARETALLRRWITAAKDRSDTRGRATGIPATSPGPVPQ